MLVLSPSDTCNMYRCNIRVNKYILLDVLLYSKRIQMILFKILENEDSYKDVEFIISKVNCYFP